jgi:DNA primase
VASQTETSFVDVLIELGVEVRRVSGNEVAARCPVHHKYKGRDSTRTSWSMNIESGLWHCWTCGARGNLMQLVRELSADPMILWNVQKQVIASGFAPEERTHEHVPKAHIDWVQYAEFELVPDKVLALRHLHADVARRFGIRWDTSNRSIIIPIVSPSGDLLGWQAKKSGWFNNYPEGVRKGSTLFGIERATEPIGLLLESPLDVVRFHSVVPSGVSAVASFGASVSQEQIDLLVDKFEGLILAMDNDESGHLSTIRLSKSLSTFRRGVRYWKYNEDSPKDLGELSDEAITTGLSEASRIPPAA